MQAKKRGKVGLMRIPRSLPAFLLTVALVLPNPAAAQEPQKPKEEQKPPAAIGEEEAKPTRSFLPALFINLGDDLKHMPRWNSLFWLAGGGALALAAHPNDNRINRRLTSDFADAVFVPGKVIGSTSVILGACATAYLVGRHKGMKRLQHLGMDEIEAALLAEGISQGLKAIVRRDRPLTPAGVPGAGGYSFPSGHATMTFAAATVLQQHLGYKAGVPTYLVASYVAMSRLHDNRHHLSDVIFGAATGIVIGRSVTWHGRNFYGYPLVVPGGGGIGFSVLTGER